MTAENTEPLPTRSEIADENDLDGSHAINSFYGKTLKEAEALIAQGCRDSNPLTYTEDLLWMEPVGFRFYVRAAIAVCLSDDATGECDFISSMAGTISLWDQQHPGELAPCARLLADFCSAVVTQFERYDADPGIYTGLREKYEHLGHHFTRLSTPT